MSETLGKKLPYITKSQLVPKMQHFLEEKEQKIKWRYEVLTPWRRASNAVRNVGKLILHWVRLQIICLWRWCCPSTSSCSHYFFFYTELPKISSNTPQKPKCLKTHQKSPLFLHNKKKTQITPVPKTTQKKSPKTQKLNAQNRSVGMKTPANGTPQKKTHQESETNKKSWKCPNRASKQKTLRSKGIFCLFLFLHTHSLSPFF